MQNFSPRYFREFINPSDCDPLCSHCAHGCGKVVAHELITCVEFQRAAVPGVVVAVLDLKARVA